MCGIVGYIGDRNAVDVVVQGIHDLEYRGYQAAGIVALINGEFVIEKRLERGAGADKITPAELLRDWQKQTRLSSYLCVGHTRWPTHGANNLTNAHPHLGYGGRVVVVHNGTITNFDSLRRELQNARVQIKSETDTELVAHMVEQQIDKGLGFEEAIEKTLVRLHGSYAFLFIDKFNPDKIIAAALGSPLVVGLSEDECIIASDEAAVARVAKKRRVVDVKDGDVLVINKSGILGGHHIDRPVSVDPNEIDRTGFAHHMLKEIMEQPRVVSYAMNHGGRINTESGMPRLGGFNEYAEKLAKLDHIVLVACGTAYHAALIGQRYFRDIAGIPAVEVMIASEADISHLRAEKTAIVAISQSGETFDTKRVVEEAKRKHILTIGVVNRPGSWIARETDCGVYCQAGLEVAVASTKAFVSQLSVLYLIAIYFGRQRGLREYQGKELLHGLIELPSILKSMLNDSFLAQCKKVAEEFLVDSAFVAFIGRGLHYPLALEGALKLKEIVYIPSEGYATGEMKHGPLALLSIERPTVAIIARDETMQDAINGLMEAKSTGSPIVVVADETERPRISDIMKGSRHTIITTPVSSRFLSPIVKVIPLQLLAYYTALKMGREIDKPRQLAKSVTVG